MGRSWFSTIRTGTHQYGRGIRTLEFSETGRIEKVFKFESHDTGVQQI